MKAFQVSMQNPANGISATTTAPAWLASWANRHPRWAEPYLQLDPRSLGGARIYLAILLLADLWQRAPTTPAWALPLVGAIYTIFLVGYRTRIFHALALVSLIGLSRGVQPFEVAPPVTLQLVCAWTLFLPLGARFSVDAFWQRLRQPKEVRPEALSLRHLFAPNTAPVISLAAMAIVLQLALLFASRLLSASSGEAPPQASAQLPLGPVVMLAAVALLLNPWLWKLSRTLALLLASAYAVRFSNFNAIGLFLLFVPAQDWAWLARALGPSAARSRIVYIDASCGVCFALARLLARLDSFNLLTILANDQPERPADLTDELVESTIVVDDPITKRRWIKAAAFAQIFAALPGGAPMSWLLRVPLVGWLAEPAYDLFARNRGRVSVALGMAACGLPTRLPTPNQQVVAGGPAQVPGRDLLATTREAAVLAALGVACWILLTRGA